MQSQVNNASVSKAGLVAQARRGICRGPRRAVMARRGAAGDFSSPRGERPEALEYSLFVPLANDAKNRRLVVFGNL